MTNRIPRLPVLDWVTFSGPGSSDTTCLLSQTGLRFTSSGRASILLALEILEVGVGDKILVPSYHCPTMIAPVVARGAEPIFYALDSQGAPKLHDISPEIIKNVRAILVAHFFGLPQPFAHVRNWCDENGICLIEDCAHALFGNSEGRPVGRWGDLAIASLTKFLPVPEGGCLLQNTATGVIPELQRLGLVRQFKAGLDMIHNGVLHNRLKGFGTAVGILYRLRALARRSPNKPPEPSGSSPSDPTGGGGFNVDIAQAHHALSYVSKWIARLAPRHRIVARRRQNYDFFLRSLTGLTGMRPLNTKLPDNCAPYVFPLWVDNPDPGYATLRQLDFPVSRWDRLWPTVPRIEGDSGIDMSHHVLQLACHQDLTQGELQTMTDLLKEVYAQA